MNAQSEEFRLYFARVRPIYNELFSMAHVICGNYEQAEFALSTVILTGWHNRRSFRSARAFRENMRADMRHIALAQASAGEITWELRPADDDDDGIPRISDIQDDPSVLRAVMLRYGCGLSLKEISRITGQTRRQADRMLKRFVRRLERRLNASRPEALLEDMCINEMTAAAGAPDAGAIFRNFESEAERSYRPGGRMAKRVISAVCYILAVIIACGAIWFVSALIRPSRITDDGLLTETLSEQ